MGRKKGSSTSDSKKSVKTSKLAKMNEQERVKYMERKLAEEEESRRRKEEMIQAFLKIKLVNEENAVKINSDKIILHWRIILREAKSESLKKDIHVLKEGFERALQKKNSHLDILMKDLSESEEQHNAAFRCQIQVINELMNIHNSRLAKLVEFHDTERRTLLHRSHQYTDQMSKNQAISEEYLDNVQIAIDHKHSSIEQNLIRDYQKLRDEVRNKNMEEKQTLHLQKEEGIENLMQKIRQQVSLHQKATEDKRRLYDFLLAKDKKDIEEVAENNKKIKKLTDEVNRLKQKFTGLGEFENRKLLNLRQEKEELMSSLFKSRKEIGIIHRNVEETKLKKFVVMLNNLKESVSTQMDRFESIVKIAEQCQRYEDVNDHLRPQSSLLHESQNHDYLEFLHYKMNNAAMELESLKSENNCLEKEQNELKIMLSLVVKRAVSRVGGNTTFGGVTDLKGNGC